MILTCGPALVTKHIFTHQIFIKHLLREDGMSAWNGDPDLMPALRGILLALEVHPLESNLR